MSDIKAELLVLKAENAELRRERDFYFQQVTENGERAHGAIDALNAENEKLRELVRIAGTYCVNGMCGKDDGCPLYLGKPYCALHDRMRELGVDA